MGYAESSSKTRVLSIKLVKVFRITELVQSSVFVPLKHSLISPVSTSYSLAIPHSLTSKPIITLLLLFTISKSSD